VRVRYGTSAFSGANVPVLLGQEVGTFESAGLEIEQTTITATTAFIPALLSDSIDVTLGTLQNTVPIILDGEEIALFCGLATYKGGNLLVGSDSDLKSVDELGTWEATLKQMSGLTVGVAAIGAEDHERFVSSLEAAGVDPGTVSFVQAVGPTAVPALTSGQIDALVAYPFNDVKLESSNEGRSILVLGPPDGPPSFTQAWSFGFVAKRSWLDENSDTATSMCEAVQASIDALDDPAHEAALDELLMANGITENELAGAKAALGGYGFSTDLPQEKIESSGQLLVDAGILTEMVPYDTLVWKAA
jgi:ABC-type nitrate/sulfonate/bicarbonate transport system substrate-binding protein